MVHELLFKECEDSSLAEFVDTLRDDREVQSSNAKSCQSFRDLPRYSSGSSRTVLLLGRVPGVLEMDNFQKLPNHSVSSYIQPIRCKVCKPPEAQAPKLFA